MSRLVLLLLICAGAKFVQAGTPAREAFQPFIKSYCINCHGLKTQKGDRRFDLLPVVESDIEAAELLQEVLDQLNPRGDATGK